MNRMTMIANIWSNYVKHTNISNQVVYGKINLSPVIIIKLFKSKRKLSHPINRAYSQEHFLPFMDTSIVTRSKRSRRYGKEN